MTREKCIICERKINRTRTHNRSEKENKFVTCSKECAKVYLRCYAHLVNRTTRKLKGVKA